MVSHVVARAVNGLQWVLVRKSVEMWVIIHSCGGMGEAEFFGLGNNTPRILVGLSGWPQHPSRWR